ncbi:MAG: aldolase/citrate lyase family protein [Planctomycetota bacterium]
MRRSRVLEKLRAGKAVRMCNLGHFMPAFIKHAAHAGYDVIWLDLEHRAMQVREVQALLAYFHLYDIDCMLRAPTLERTGLYRYLEDGATGLMIPLVANEAEAKALAAATKFPPIGNRGLDGAGIDNDFYLGDSSSYTELANRETFLVLQIETLEAMAEVDKIAAVPGVDGLFLGPADMGLRLRVGGKAPYDLDGAIDRVAAAAAKHGKAWGMPAGTPEQYRNLHARGARLLNYGGEFSAMMEMFQRCKRGSECDSGARVADSNE